jgi:hypothetical protein
MGFIKFMSSSAGRWTRGIAGLALLAIGIASNTIWLSVVGAIVAAAGIFDICIFAPLWKLSLSGKKTRAHFSK